MISYFKFVRDIFVAFTRRYFRNEPANAYERLLFQAINDFTEQFARRGKVIVPDS